MEAGFTLIVLIILAILIIPLILAFSTNSKVNAILNELINTKAELKNVKNKLAEILNQSQNIVQPEEQINTVKQEGESISHETIIPAAVPRETFNEEILESEKEVPRETIGEETIEPVIIQEEIVEEAETVPRETVQVSENILEQTNEMPLSNKPSWNLEKFIGEKLISIVGIAILVLGIFFTVKWAVDRNLMSDGAKIIMGLLSGTILVAIAHKLSKSYRAFSSILAGGAIAVFYFSVYESFQAYHLISQTVAFAAMILITLFAVIMSVIYNKKELAIIAIIGGFLTPFLISTGAGNYKVLFSYLLILNIGMFVLAYFKKWNIVNLISYALTIAIFGSWMLNDYKHVTSHARNGMLFASLFFLVFFGMNLIYTVRNKSKFEQVDLALLLVNTFSYFGVGLYFLYQFSGDSYQGLFTAALAIFNFVFAFLFYKRKQIDSNLNYFLIGLVLTFVSLIAPIQMEGNYITLFWSCEMVLLFWLGTKSGISLIKNTSMLMLILSIISLIMDWQNNYYSVHTYKMNPLLNKAFITGVLVLLGVVVKKRLVKNDNDTHYSWGLIERNQYNMVLHVLIIILLYAIGFLELTYQINTSFHLLEFSAMIQWLYQFTFAFILLLYGFKKGIKLKQEIVLIIGFIPLILYPFADRAITNLRNVHLLEHKFNALYSINYFIPLIALSIMYLIIQYIRTHIDKNNNKRIAAAWLLTVVFLFICSSVATHIWTNYTYQPGFSLHDGFRKASKVAWPILWSLTSLALMIWGMQEKIKHLRIISLSLFALTTLKLFIYDISNVSQGGKIAAFLILGIILLLVAFLYQRIKGIFIQDETSN